MIGSGGGEVGVLSVAGCVVGGCIWFLLIIEIQFIGGVEVQFVFYCFKVVQF